MRRNYRRWLEEQSYSSNTVQTQTSHATRLEQAYGDLDDHYDADRLADIASTLVYSSTDARRGLPNPSRFQINGDLYKSLASFRTALALYRRFRQETSEQIGPEAAPAPRLNGPDAGERPTDGARIKLGLERDLQGALRREIGQLEPGLSVDDDGVERNVASGYIDITARDAEGALVVIELKAATADRAAIGQILSYMGDLADEEGCAVRGILVAHDFDAKARSAARMVPNLILRAYAVRFAFTDAGLDAGRSSPVDVVDQDRSGRPCS